MKTYKNLYENIASFENLIISSKKAFKGTRNRDAYRFYFNLENEVIRLLNELKTETYKPSNYRYFKIYDPKEREISVADFKDRVVHHAVVNILEPIYEKIFIYDSYATRKNKGTHKAILRVQEFSKINNWYLKTDIKKHFENIDEEIMMNILKRKIKDKKTINLIEKIIRNGGKEGKGLPIGNLTSQFFANVYLDILDHYIKDELGVKYYVRYMDDIVVLSNNKDDLIEIRDLISDFLMKELKLEIKEKATFINHRLNGISFCGVRIFPNMIRIKNPNLRRYIKKIREKEEMYLKDEITEEELAMSVQSYIALLEKYNTFNLRKSIF